MKIYRKWCANDFLNNDLESEVYSNSSAMVQVEMTTYATVITNM